MQWCHLARSSKQLGMVGNLHARSLVDTGCVLNFLHTQRSSNTDCKNKKHLHKRLFRLRSISLRILDQNYIGFDVSSCCYKNSVHSAWISHTSMSVIRLPERNSARIEGAK